MTATPGKSAPTSTSIPLTARPSPPAPTPTVPAPSASKAWPPAHTHLRVCCVTPQSYSITITPPVVPSAVTGVSANSGDYGNAVVVTWTASPGAVSYSVSRNTTDNSSSATKLDSSPVTGPTSYADTTAVSGTTYYYFVQATNSLGNSAFSAGVSGTLGASTEPSVTNLASATTISCAGAPGHRRRANRLRHHRHCQPG